MELFDAEAVDPFLGRTLGGQYALTELLATGATSRVYKATQAQPQRSVAVKVLAPKAHLTDDTFRARFVREAAITARLKHHNTISVLDYGQESDGVLFLVMELVDGKTLAQVLTREGRLQWKRAVNIGCQIARGLGEAHAAGVLHRDLKPSNVMMRVDGDGELVKVLDFGLVKTFGDGARTPDLTKKGGVFLATPRYMAPEQARHQASPRSDIYSLGVVLYEALAGKPPFGATGAVDVVVQHISEPVPPFSVSAPGILIPPAVEAVVRKCLEKKPEDRFQTMDALHTALKATVETAELPVPSGVALGAEVHEPVTMPETPAVADDWEPPTDETKLPAHILEDLKPKRPDAQAEVTDPMPHQVRPLRPAEPAPAITAPSPPPAAASAAPITEPESRAASRPWGLWALVAVLALALAGVGARELLHRPAAGAPHAVRFVVESAPTGASVQRGAERLGETPLSFEVAPGADGVAEQELDFQLAGFTGATLTASGSGEVRVKAKLTPMTP